MKDKKVLIVDDDRLFLESTADMLEGEYTVLKASTAREAYDILVDKAPNCIVCDIVMPGESGVDFLMRIREEGFDIPFIVMTANSSQEHAERCADLNIQGYVNKPVDEIRLKERIKRAIDHGGRNPFTNKNRSIHPSLGKMVDYIHKNFEKDLTASQVASEAGVAYGYLAELFKKGFGMSFTNYLNRLRVGEAKKLIMTTDLMLKEVAARVGFNSEPHFYRQFKRFTGLTPRSLMDERVKKTENRQ